MTREQSERKHTVTPTAVVMMIFVLLVVAGVVAIVYSPVVSALFYGDVGSEVEQPPTDRVQGAPAPDNSVTSMPPGGIEPEEEEDEGIIPIPGLGGGEG